MEQRTQVRCSFRFLRAESAFANHLPIRGTMTEDVSQNIGFF